MRKTTRLAVAGSVAALALSLAACGGGDSASSTSSTTAATTTTTTAAPTSKAAANGVTTNADVFGSACASLPTGDAPGSLNNMGPAPVASAASTNPLLKTLVALVTKAGLVDTLNSQQALTVFAPADAAFEAMGAKATEVSNNPELLKKVLTYHVVPKRYDKAGLLEAKTVDTLQGGKVNITGSGDNLLANDAPILCGNIPTKNATVFVVGKVLSPA